MTPNEMNLLKSLVVVAWADGKLEDGEFGVIDGLLCSFGANDQEEEEIISYAKTPRRLEDDLEVSGLSPGDRELLMTNATLLTLVDGDLSQSELSFLNRLAGMLEVSKDEFEAILSSVRESAERISGLPPPAGFV